MRTSLRPCTCSQHHLTTFKGRWSKPYASLGKTCGASIPFAVLGRWWTSHSRFPFISRQMTGGVGEIPPKWMSYTSLPNKKQQTTPATPDFGGDDFFPTCDPAGFSCSVTLRPPAHPHAGMTSLPPSRGDPRCSTSSYLGRSRCGEWCW